MKKPVIGIVGKHVDLEWYGWQAISISDSIRFVLLSMNAVPLGILPTTQNMVINETATGDARKLSPEEEADLIVLINLCDGLILQGGIHSQYYEEFIAKYCFDNDIPILGICAGFNTLILGVGGNIVKSGNLEIHNRPDLKYAHEIKIDRKSNLFNIVQKEKLLVNSIHEHLAEDIGNLKATAFSDDGTIEAVEAESKAFYLGVKFHPEILQDDDCMMNIFKKFLEICKQRI